jgi:hypothetical protein
MKLKLGMQIGGKLLIAKHLDNYYDWPIRNREQQSDHIYYTLFWQAFGFAVPFSIRNKLCNSFAEVKPFC